MRMLQAEIFGFSRSCTSKSENGWSDITIRNVYPLPPLKGQNKRKTQPIHEIINILTSPKNPKFQSLDGTSARIACVVLSSALSFSLLVDIYFSSSIDLEEAC